MKVDCGLIVMAACAPVIFYLRRSGFYSDDWPVLAQMHLAADQSFLGLFRALLALDNAVRPVQWMWLAALFKVFGLSPLGYHLANTALIALGAFLLYVCLRQLREPHLFVVAVPLVYALLPQYSTDRLWMAAAHANVSACLFFLAFYADLRAISSSRAYWRWKTLAMISIGLSALAYEAFLPLVVVASSFIAVRYIVSPRDGVFASRRRLLLVLATNLLVLIAVVLAKGALNARADQFKVTPARYIGTMMLSLKVSYVDHVVKIPFTLWQIVGHYATWRELVTGAIVGLMLAGYLCHTGVAMVRVESVSRRRMLMYVVLGLVVSIAGFSLFPIIPTMTGINNRTANAASVGVALSIVGAIGYIAGWSAAWKRWTRVFAVSIAVIGVSGLLTVSTVAAFWRESYNRQREVLAAIERQWPTLPEGTSLMLDGVCPYDGPAIVFDTPWDLAGALMLLYGHSNLRADVLSFQVSVTENGLVVRSYNADELYPYDHLYVYNFRLRDAYAMHDAAAARAYLTGIRATVVNDCPEGRHGAGAEILGMSLTRLLSVIGGSPVNR